MARKSNETMAAEKGITVEALLAEREQNKKAKLPGSVKSAAMSFVRDSDKVATLAAEREQAHRDVDAKFDAKVTELGGELSAVRAALVAFAGSLKVSPDALDAFIAEYQTQRLDRKGDGSEATK